VIQKLRENAMRKLLTAGSIILLLGLAAGPGQADEGGDASPAGAARASGDNRLLIQQQDRWQFIFSPYLWLPGADLRTTVKGTSTVVTVPWWDVVPDLFTKAIGGMGRFEAWKGRWGFFLDSYFIYLGGDVNVSTGRQVTQGPLQQTRTLVLSGDLKYITRAGNLDFGPRLLVGTAALRADQPLPVLSLELLGGGRFNYYHQYLRLGVSRSFTGPVLDRTRGRTLTVNFTRSYVEPLVGLRLGLWLTDKAVITMRGTFGGFALVADSNFDSDLEMTFGYRVHPKIYTYLGYRARYDQFSKTDLSFSGWVHGPVLGMAFVF
jgi:hypothetical protein